MHANSSTGFQEIVVHVKNSYERHEAERQELELIEVAKFFGTSPAYYHKRLYGIGRVMIYINAVHESYNISPREIQENMQYHVTYARC
jgi:hypothetical protein